MRRIRIEYIVAVSMLGAWGALPARASAAQGPVRLVSVSQPFTSEHRLTGHHLVTSEPPLIAAARYGMPAAPLTADIATASYGVTASPPGTNDGLYVDWVSPLQAPRGLAPADFAPPGEAFRDAGQAFPASDADGAPLSIPETSTLGLIGTALLPMLGFLFRRRN